MKRVFPFAIIAAVGIIGTARAQVINGESTYEDNYYHSPPGGGAKAPTPSPPPQAHDDGSGRLRGDVYPNDRDDDPSSNY